MSAPTITGLTAFSLTEGDAAIAIDQGLSFSGGSNFTGGFIRFNVSDSNSGDQFELSSGADANLSGAISVDADGIVYLGTGAGRDAIGSIDAVENGQNGAALKINIGISTGAVVNSGFEDGLTGWTVGTDRVILGTTMIGGYVTPTDATIPPSAGDDAGPVNSMTYSSELSNDEHTQGATSLRLYNSGNTAAGFDVVHGPYAVSNIFHAEAGEIFRFDWRAQAGGDAYDAFGYLLNTDSGAAVVVLNQTGADDSGQTPWTSEAIVVPTTGNWSFVFIAGTYDFTGGRAVGGSLFIDNIRSMTPSPVDDAILKTIASQVTFQNTSNEAVATRSLSLVVSDGLGNTQSADADLDITNIQNEPLGLALTGRAKLGETLSAANSFSDPDGFDPATVTYQWQHRGAGGVWTDIQGETGSTYQVTSGDFGYSIRVVAQYTDNGGELETIASRASARVADPSESSQTGLNQLANTATGAAGSDSISGLEGADTLQGALGDDSLNGNQDNDILQGNQGTDTLHGGQGDDIVHGGRDDDFVFGDLGDDIVFGDLGNDLVNGGEGDDMLWGGQGAVSDMADGADTLVGGGGDDFVNGNGGSDAIDGGVGNDTIHGGQGDDVIFGSDGDDLIFGDIGDDVVSGGSGADSFQMHGGGRDLIVDFSQAQGDRIVLNAGASYTASQVGADTIVDWENGQIVLSNVQLSNLNSGWIVA